MTKLIVKAYLLVTDPEWKRKAARSLVYFFFGMIVLAVLTNLLVFNYTQPSKPIQSYAKKNAINKSSFEPNFSKERSRVIDSLIDAKALTVENLEWVKARFPDSLCDCD